MSTEASSDWIVAGLGNPGPRYAGTRHDLGFALVARLADSVRASFRSIGDADLAGPLDLDGGRAHLVRPLRYMNRSGAPLARVAGDLGVAPERVLVACDDVNLPLGRIRMRASGSDGGHNGLKSIIAELGEGFPRLRLGVGAPPEGVEQSEWVLSRFDGEEIDTVREMLERAAALVREAVSSGRVSAVTSNPPDDEGRASPSGP